MLNLNSKKLVNFKLFIRKLPISKIASTFKYEFGIKEFLSSDKLSLLTFLKYFLLNLVYKVTTLMLFLT